jgi:AcrR family transcriptional regulator
MSIAKVSLSGRVCNCANDSDVLCIENVYLSIVRNLGGVHELIENRGKMSNSRDKLLRAAEVLFSSKRFREVSVREIAAQASINIGLISYYFRGKQALYDEVLRVHAIPLSRERMERLRALTMDGRKPSVEEILRAWFIPWLQLGCNRNRNAVHFRITANMSCEKWRTTKNVFGASPAVRRAFINALHSCLPYLSTESIMWRLQFFMSALINGMQLPNSLMAISERRCDPTDLEATFNQLLPFACAGFCAPDSARMRESESHARR